MTLPSTLSCCRNHFSGLKVCCVLSSSVPARYLTGLTCKCLKASKAQAHKLNYLTSLASIAISEHLRQRPSAYRSTNLSSNSMRSRLSFLGFRQELCQAALTFLQDLARRFPSLTNPLGQLADLSFFTLVKRSRLLEATSFIFSPLP